MVLIGGQSMPLNSNLAFKSKFPICSICNEPVEAETTKINEIGEPVHEECCELKVGLKKATTLKKAERRRRASLVHQSCGGQFGGKSRLKTMTKAQRFKIGRQSC
jgi:hypothetical protein